MMGLDLVRFEMGYSVSTMQQSHGELGSSASSCEYTSSAC